MSDGFMGFSGRDEESDEAVIHSKFLSPTGKGIFAEGIRPN
jgi:hypothetical protein